MRIQNFSKTFVTRLDLPGNGINGKVLLRKFFAGLKKQKKLLFATMITGPRINAVGRNFFTCYISNLKRRKICSVLHNV
jgi:hypothetical protein